MKIRLSVFGPSGNCLRLRVALSEEDSGVQQTAKLDTKVKVQTGYLLYLPKHYDKHDSWPLLLFLHGLGERGDDPELVKKLGPSKLIAEGKDFSFIVISLQCPKDRWWKPIELVAMLDDLGSKYKVDADRIYLTGLSVGGWPSVHRTGSQRLPQYVEAAKSIGPSKSHICRRRSFAAQKIPVYPQNGPR